MKHILFYDHDCPLCNRSIRFVFGADKKQHFSFAPLQGKTAKKELSELPFKNSSLDTLVLLQDYGMPNQRQFLEGKGAFRVLWLLGGKYKLLGWLSFLPSFLFDACYRLLARYRYRLFKPKPLPVIPSARLLP